MLYPTGIKAAVAASGKAAPATGLPPGLASLPAGTLLSGTVVGRAGAGQLLLRTVAGLALIDTTLKLARGTVVKLRVRGGAAPVPAHGATPYLTIESVAGQSGLAGPPQPGLSFGLASELNEALAELRKIDPGLADAVVRRASAVPGDKLASAVLFFMAALKRGDFTGWFGDAAAKALEGRGHADLLTRLRQHFGQPTRLAEQPASGEWQALFVPLHDGETVRQLRFFFRRRRNGAGDGSGDGDDDRESRFVVEIESSRLGGLQLDGLVGADRFDLVLRSHKPLPDVARRDISEIFTGGLAITGQAGKIAFQTVESFPISPMDRMLGQANRGFLV